MRRVDASTMLDMKIRSKDGVLVGKIVGLEADLENFQIAALKIETSRDILERLSLAEPSITGGRITYIPTKHVSHVDTEVHLSVDALDLADLHFGRMDSMV